MTCIQCGAHQFIARVIDGGCPGIRDQGHIPLVQPGQDRIEFGQFIVFEVAGQGGMDVKVGEQFPGHARVFRGDQAGFLQDARGARAEVFEVADRGGNEIKGAHACILSPVPADAIIQRWLTALSTICRTRPSWTCWTGSRLAAAC